MHEMSIVCGIFDIVRDHAERAGGGTVLAVEIEVGRLAGVEIDSLEFCFRAARAHAIGGQAELIVHQIPGRGVCPSCGAEAEMDFYAAVCPACGKASLEVRQGGELKVRSIRVG